MIVRSGSVLHHQRGIVRDRHERSLSTHEIRQAHRERLERRLTRYEERIEVQLDESEVDSDVPARAEDSEEDGIDESHRGGKTVGRNDQFDESVEDSEERQTSQLLSRCIESMARPTSWFATDQSWTC